MSRAKSEISKRWPMSGPNIVPHENYCIAGGTRPSGCAAGWILFSYVFLQDRFLAAMIAGCTQPMSWFGSLCLFFQNISHRSGKQFTQLIFLLLSFPSFQASHFFFKCAYFLQQRRALVLCRKRGAIGLNELGLKFDELGLKGCSIPQTYHRLRDILGRIERREGSCKGTDIGHAMSL